MQPEQPASNQPSQPVFDPSGKVEHINEGEVKIARTGRHLFGLAVIYIQAILALVLALGLIIPFAGDAFEAVGLGRGLANSVSALLGLVVFALGALYVILASRIYLASELIVTNDNVTQVTQVGLFHRKVSEISMGNVEDVSVHKKGIFQAIFNFGRLHIETAGEQNNYDFIYCPNPEAYAKAIQDARLLFLKTHGN